MISIQKKYKWTLIGFIIFYPFILLIPFLINDKNKKIEEVEKDIIKLGKETEEFLVAFSVVIAKYDIEFEFEDYFVKHWYKNKYNLEDIDLYDILKKK